MNGYLGSMLSATSSGVGLASGVLVVSPAIAWAALLVVLALGSAALWLVSDAAPRKPPLIKGPTHYRQAA